MKKDIEARKVVPPVNDADEDDMLPEYDFSKAVRANYHRRFHEGDRVQINGAPFRVSGRDFVPEAEYKQPDKPSG